MRLSKSFVLKQLAAVAGLMGAGTLLSLPALAASSYSEGMTIAQASGGSSDGAEGGEAFEQTPGGSAPSGSGSMDDSNSPSGTTDSPSGTTMDEGAGSGTGGVQQDGVNPANPDAEGGDAFEREPTGEPLPSETEGMDSTSPSGTPSGTTTDEGAGSGQGGSNNPVNPANPDPTGGDAYEQTPGTQPLPDSNEQSGGESGTFNQSGTTTDTGAGGGAGGASTSVRALW